MPVGTNRLGERDERQQVTICENDEVLGTKWPAVNRLELENAVASVEIEEPGCREGRRMTQEKLIYPQLVVELHRPPGADVMVAEEDPAPVGRLIPSVGEPRFGHARSVG